MNAPLLSWAIFSPDRIYRYALGREALGGNGTVVSMSLNPSRADETTDDPTIRRDLGFARAWGYGRLVKLNLGAYITPYPREVLAAGDWVGPENDATILRFAGEADRVLVAWGAVHRRFLPRVEAVVRLLSGLPLYCLGVTKGGQPCHPLYRPAGQPIEIWAPCEPQRWAREAGT